MIKFYSKFLIVFFIVLLAYFPLGLYLFSFIALALIAYSNVRQKNILYFIFFVFLIFSICINEASVQRFLYREDDFTTYYDNYISLLNGDYSSLFQFGGGIEIGLPVSNLIISNIIRGPYPYIFQMFYITIFAVLMFFLSKYINRFNHRLDKKLVLLWGMLFLKITSMLTIERQAMASLFVLFSFFDLRKRYLWLIIACLFHISSPLVYIFARVLLTVKKFSSVFKYTVFALVLTIFSYQILSLVIQYFPNDKVGYVLYHINNEAFIINEVIKSIKQITYIVPLFLLASIRAYYGYKWHLYPSLTLFIILMLVTSTLPGVPTRIFMPFVYCLFGFYYYDFLVSINKKYQIILFLIIALVFFFQKMFTVGYYYRYPLVDTKPFYYLSHIFEPYTSVNRLDLNKRENVKIINENKL